MRRNLGLVVALALASLPVRADYYFSPDVPTSLAGVTYLPWNVVRKDDAGVYSLVLSLPTGTAIDALYRMSSGDWLLSVSSPTSLGGTTYGPRDVIRFDGIATYSLFFNGAAAGVPAGSNVDAAFLDGSDTGDLIVSFDVPTIIGGATFEPADLVRFSGGIFSTFFDASATVPAIPISTNVTGAGRRGSRTFLTFDVPTTLGARTYLPGQALSWDGSSFAPFSLDLGWPTGSRLNALALGSCLDGDGDGYGSPGDVSCLAGGLIDCNDNASDVYPGAPQLCDGINNDCSDPAWPAVPANEADADGDGVRICAGDCDDTSNSVWGTPGEVSGLALSGTALNWVAPPAIGGIPSSIRYDTIRSTIPGDFVSAPPATCVESNDGPNTTATDPTTPIAGTPFYYLVRAENACPGNLGVGPLGTLSSGTPRAARDCP